MKNIEDWSFRYAFFRPLIRAVFRLTFRKIEVEGLDNIPKDKPIIFAPNHQNALTDALTIVYSYSPQPVFLARADIFKKKLIISLLTFFKIMPVFRIRDGYDSLSKNEETFGACIRLLKKNRTLTLFPEAAHHGQKSMLPHKKAIPRIVFMAGERTNFELDLCIVPVGINYTHYYKFRSDLVIRYGNPIHVNEFYEIYQKESENSATNALRDKIFNELEKVCVHVPDKNLYEVYIRFFEILERDCCLGMNRKITPMNLFKTEQYLIEKIASMLNGESKVKEKIVGAALQYGKLREELKLNESTIQKGKIVLGELLLSYLTVLLLVPLAIAGFVLFAWLFYLVNYSFRAKIKDPQFYSSFSYALTLVVLPIWLIILFIIGLLVLKNWFLATLSIVLSVPSGIIAWETIQLMIGIKERLRFRRLLKLKNEILLSMLRKREFLVAAYKNS